MRAFSAITIILAAAFFAACASGGRAAGDAASLDEARISALGAIGRAGAALGPMFEGDGGEGLTLAVFAPEVQGEVPAYLPMYIQGLLINNFNRYSAVAIFDRQNLDRIIAEQVLALGGLFSDTDAVSVGQLANVRYLLFGSVQQLPGGRYSLQLSVTDSESVVRRWNVMRDGPLQRIEGSGALINEATAELLEQMGVRLSDSGRRALLTGNTLAAQAEAGFARGIAAEAAGSQVEALLNFTQSIAFDPSQLEALSRLNTLSSTISGGTISERILNDVEARARWLEAFTETARFFNSHPPFEIAFDPNLIQEGEIDYMKRNPTVNIAMRIALEPSDAGFGALNALLEGLEKTGRREPWGFSGWPLEDVRPRARGTVVFDGKRSFSFKVDVSLVNENGRAVSWNSVTLRSGTLRFSPGDASISAPEGDGGMVRFSKVRAADLSPTMTIVITAVNGIPSQRLSSTGYMRIEARNDLPYRSNRGDFKWKRHGTGISITGYRETGGIVTIPSEINGRSVTSIGRYAFWGSRRASITIPNSVTSIEHAAFSSNRLSSITIPDSVTSIGSWAFTHNFLTNITIPDSVTSIGTMAFHNNRLTSVTIPYSVISIGSGAFSNNQLTSVNIPNSVNSIEDGTFSNNQLTSVTIPNSVNSIGSAAFFNNQLTSITIGANVPLDVTLDFPPFNNGFEETYNINGRRAGTYTRPDTNSWTWTLR